MKKMAIEDGLEYCIIRCRDAGVHAGFVLSIDENRVILKKSRRLWGWWGKTLSGLAQEGTFAPERCKFANEIDTIELNGWCERIPCTEQAMESIREVGEWINE